MIAQNATGLFYTDTEYGRLSNALSDWRMRMDIRGYFKEYGNYTDCASRHKCILMHFSLDCPE